MKAVILAGGYGTRITEESALKPKPMIEIGDKPILWHIMKLYSQFGISEFIVCCGYKGYLIKEYFANYFLHMSDVTVSIDEASRVEIHRQRAEPWKITMVDTGRDTLTGGRLLRVKDYVGDETFCMTYGDGVSDVDMKQLLARHTAHGKLATVTAVQPPARYGAISFDGDRVAGFEEKPKGDGAWINGGFFVLEPGIFHYIADDKTIWEQEPLRQLAADGELIAHRHEGFWAAMDTLRDKNHLEELWASGHAPWKSWA